MGALLRSALRASKMSASFLTSASRSDFSADRRKSAPRVARFQSRRAVGRPVRKNPCKHLPGRSVHSPASAAQVRRLRRALSEGRRARRGPAAAQLSTGGASKSHAAFRQATASAHAPDGSRMRSSPGRARPRKGRGQRRRRRWQAPEVGSGLGKRRVGRRRAGGAR